MKARRAGLLMLLAAVPGMPAMVLFPFAYWGFVALGIALCARDPALRRGALPAFVVLAVLVAWSMAAAGTTIGTASGPVAYIDGAAPIVAAFLLVPVAPPMVMLALVERGTVRTLARFALAGFAVSLALSAWAFTLDVRSGARAEGMSIAIVLLAIPFLAALAAMALAWWHRPPQVAAASTASAPQG